MDSVESVHSVEQLALISSVALLFIGIATTKVYMIQIQDFADSNR